MGYIAGYNGILWDNKVIMFFRKDPPQTEGRRDAHPLIKTSPVIPCTYYLVVVDHSPATVISLTLTLCLRRYSGAARGLCDD